LRVLLRLHRQYPIVQVAQVVGVRIRLTSERLVIGGGSAAIRPYVRWLDSGARHLHDDLVSILFDERAKLLVDQETRQQRHPLAIRPLLDVGEEDPRKYFSKGLRLRGRGRFHQ
jgi:hypothetical protein